MPEAADGYRSRTAISKGAAIILLLPLTRWKLREEYTPPGCNRFVKLGKPAKRRELMRSLAELIRMPRYRNPRR